MIEYIFFDIGGVLIKDFSATDKWDDLFRELGVTEENKAEFHRIWDAHFPRFCLDDDVDATLPALREAGFPIPENYSLLQDGFVNRFEKNESLWTLLETLDPTRCGIISNMYPRMLDAIFAANILPPKVREWSRELILDSSVLGMRKPDPEIFALAAERAGVEPSKLLFVENSQEHLEAAKSAGWQTFQYDSYDYEASSQNLGTYLETLR